MNRTAVLLNIRDSGRCRTAKYPEDFFTTEDDPDYRRRKLRAQTICGLCPLRDMCLEFALGDYSLEGIWGGTTKSQRHEMRYPRCAVSRKISRK